MKSKPVVSLLKHTFHWLTLVGLLLLTLTLIRGTTAWASGGREINQTVPKPTKTPLPTLVPPATGTPKVPDPEPSNNQPSSSEPTSTPTKSANEEKRFTGTVKSKTLNLRSGPGTGYLVIAVLNEGDKVEILEQNSKGTWWRICCKADSDLRGWVSSNFITPDFDVAKAQKLIPQAVEIPPTPTAIVTQSVSSEVSTIITPAITSAATSTITSTLATPATAIGVRLVQSPTFPLQGSHVTWFISVINITQVDAVDVELRNELPEGIEIVEIIAPSDAIVQQDVTENLHQVYSILWPSLAIGEEVMVEVHVQISPDIPDGTVLDNLAFAGGKNVPGSTAGISIGMPPLTLPGFQ